MEQEHEVTQQQLNEASKWADTTGAGNIKAILVSIYVWTALFLSSVLYLPVIMFFSFIYSPIIDHKKTIARNIGKSWLRLARWIHPLWKVKHTGFENIDLNQHYVVISNHQSYGDIIVLAYLPFDYKFVSKKELFYFPSFGWETWAIGHIGVKRGDRKSVLKFMEVAKKTLNDKISLTMFAEGTRTQNGDVRNFKDGGFQLAIDTQTPILPVTIAGSYNALPRQTFIFRNRTYVRIHIDKPIPVEGIKNLEELKAKTRNIIIERKKELDREVVDSLKNWKNI